MRKTLKKLLAAMLAVSVVAGVAACGGTTIGTIDETKSQIYISYYNGGCSDTWVKQAAKIFADRYAEKSFEKDKKGVEFIWNSTKSGTAGSTVLSTIGGSQDEIYFTEAVFYPDLISGDLAYDVTDALTEPLTEFGETKSILDKLDDKYVDYFRTKTDKYYALPLYQGYKGFFYNKDVFEENGLYILADGYVCGSSDLNFGKKTDGALSKGPDGKTGVENGIDYSLDDGLPATYDEFFALCDYMKNNTTVTPFIWSGKAESYLTGAIYELWADFEGAEQMELNYNFDSGVKAKDLIDTIDADGNYTLLPEKEITNANAYYLQKQAGKYEALRFLRRLVDDSSYYTADSLSSTHTAAQLNFIQNSLIPGKEIAFISEGSWWENEAEGSFALVETKYHKNRYTLNYGLLPMPKASADKVGEERTIVCLNDTSVFINANVSDSKIDLLKLFYRFIHSDEILKLFNKVTGLTRAFDYELEDSELAAMSPLDRDMYSTIKGGRTNVLYALDNSDFYIKYNTNFQETNWGFTNDTYEQPWRAFIDHNDLTPKEYFNGLYTRAERLWARFDTSL